MCWGRGVYPYTRCPGISPLLLGGQPREGPKFSHLGHWGHWGTKVERRGFFTPLGLAPYLLSVLELPGFLQWLPVTRGAACSCSLTHAQSLPPLPQDSPGSPAPAPGASPSSASRPVSVSPPTRSLVQQQQLFPIREVTHTWGWSAQGSPPAGTWMLKCRGGGQILRGVGWGGGAQAGSGMGWSKVE